MYNEWNWIKKFNDSMKKRLYIIQRGDEIKLHSYKWEKLKSADRATAHSHVYDIGISWTSAFWILHSFTSGFYFIIHYSLHKS